MSPLFARIGGHGPADDVWSRPGVAFKRHGLTLELIRHDTEQAAARALQPGIEVTLNPRSMVARYVKVLHDQIRRQPVGFPVNGDERLELNLTGKPEPLHKVTYQYWNGTDRTVATCTGCGWFDRWDGNDGSAQQSGSAHEMRSNR